ncbi:major royal jelly protein-domain-containing protein [Xylariomycetidae sp. FL2044]|nr:major royal jelly protein-domain-containing protein [Xylariomycetidae sp. FL2044]
MRFDIFLFSAMIGSAAAQVGDIPVALNSTFSTTGPRNVRIDTGTYGPLLEEYHYFYDQWPIGLAVSRNGTIFTCYTRGTYEYTLGIVVNETAEAPYPNLEINTPPGGLSNVMNGIQLGSSDQSHFISVQSLYVTPDDTLWVLDTGRPSINGTGSPSMPYASPGGPKIVAIDLTNGTIRRTYTFPPTVHYPDSYMNDVRLDLRPNVTSSGGGIAYIVDSSNEGRNGFIMLDLGTGESWRQLDLHPSTLKVYEDVPSYQGLPFYLRHRSKPLGFKPEGVDGAELDQYGEVMYYSALTTDYLYSIETRYLRTNPATDALANIRASDNVKNLGQRGGNANGFTGDNHGNIYMLMPEQNAIFVYNSTTLTTLPYVRDPRIIWPDSADVAWDGYLYVAINQLQYSPGWNAGVDRRQYPGLILRARALDGATKNTFLN